MSRPRHFQLGDRLRYRRLGKIHLLRGQTDAASPAGCGKGAQMSQVEIEWAPSCQL
jgi:hypothetical protein